MRAEVVAMDAEHLNMEAIQKAGEILKEGGLVAFPTETVYGLGGNALDPAASMKIYAAKGRPSDNPLIVHIADLKDLARITTEIPEGAQILAKKYWPGPLTMILPKADSVPKETTGGLDSVAVRFPSDRIAQELIKAAGGFVAAPSANTSGRPSPTKAEHVMEDLHGKIPMILDGGAVMVGVESTIIDFTETVPVILRPGWITKESMEEFLGCEVLMNTSLKASDHGIPRAPGMKYKHYAPKAQMVLVLGDDQDKVVDHINQLAKEQKEQGKKIGIIASDETKDLYQADEVVSVGQRAHLETVTAHLYDVLREFDHKDVDMIYSEGFEGEPLSEAIMNRMVKAAGHEILRI